MCDWGIPWAVCYMCDWGIPWAVCYVCVIVIIIIIIIIKSLFIEVTGISKHRCVKSRLKTYMHHTHWA